MRGSRPAPPAGPSPAPRVGGDGSLARAWRDVIYLGVKALREEPAAAGEGAEIFGRVARSLPEERRVTRHKTRSADGRGR
jgi:hypothetical protein